MRRDEPTRATSFRAQRRISVEQAGGDTGGGCPASSGAGGGYDRRRVIVSTGVRVCNHMDMLRDNEPPDQADAASLLPGTQSLGHDSFQTDVV